VWRVYNDIAPSWASILSIIDFVTKNQDALTAVNGPGGWNDPDEVSLNFGF
jgi:alpha-N-acetylgalactosaminidase